MMSELSREQVARWDLSPGDTVERDVYGHFVEFYEYAVLRAKLEEQTERAEKAELVLADLRLRLNCPVEAPSCLVCGQQKPFVIQRIDAAAIGVCKECRSASNTLTDIRAQLDAMTQERNDLKGQYAHELAEVNRQQRLDLASECDRLRQQLAATQQNLEVNGRLYRESVEKRDQLQATVTAQKQELNDLDCKRRSESPNDPRCCWCIQCQLRNARATVTAQAEHIKTCGTILKTQGEQAAVAVKEYAEEIGRLRLALRYLAELGGGNSDGNYYAKATLKREDNIRATLASGKETT